MPAPPSTGTAELQHKLHGALTGTTFRIGTNVLVGRFDPELGPVDVDLGEFESTDHISRRHARIYRQGDNWLVEDLGSKNGVFIRRAAEGTRRISAPTAMLQGDEVSFGMVTFVFQLPA